MDHLILNKNQAELENACIALAQQEALIDHNRNQEWETTNTLLFYKLIMHQKLY